MVSAGCGGALLPHTALRRRPNAEVADVLSRLHCSGNAKGTPHVAAMFGWLGDVGQIDYAHRVQALRDWHLGFGIGFMDRRGTVRRKACPVVGYEVLNSWVRRGG